MGNVDVASKSYLQDNTVFADVFNYYLFHGEPRLRPEDLRELDPTQAAQLARETDEQVAKETGEQLSSVGDDNLRNRNSRKPSRRHNRHNTTGSRDLFKNAIIRSSETACYILHLGLEPQSWIDYAMPVRVGAYDYGEYQKQLKQIGKSHKDHKDYRGRSRSEFLSGFYKDDKLIPIVTLVLYLGAEQWDGPMSLHEMLAETEPEVLSRVADYKINLITPKDVSEEDLQLFQTNLREVIGCIKYSGSREQLEQYVIGNPRMNHLDKDAAQLIAVATSTEINISEESEEINMCKAIEDMKIYYKEEGRAEERARMSKAFEEIRTQCLEEGRAEERAHMSKAFEEIRTQCLEEGRAEERAHMSKAFEEIRTQCLEEGRAEERAHMSKAFEEIRTQCLEEGRAEERARMSKAFEEMKTHCKKEGKIDGILATARRMFENGMVYDLVRACTDQVVSDQMLREMEHSLQLENG